jgi:alginate O-acetyltransferase complex protein AlgI
MAMGLGHMMGFTLPQNFDRPYASQSVTEFWRRWHMTLSRWFRDYVYIPLGGNRHGAFRTYLNLAIVFLLCGLWHGASLTFIAWGAYYGLLLILERVGLGRVIEGLWRPLRHFYLLSAVIAGWVIFRADSLPHAWAFLGAMVGQGHGDGISLPYERFLSLELVVVLIVGGILAMFPSTPATRLSWGASGASWAGLGRHAARLLILCLFVLAAARVTAGTYNPFIYFRF